LGFSPKDAGLLQCRRFVNDARQAKRYFISGLVQGVGFRYFTQSVAEKLKLSGYVRNLGDGRVEVLALGTPQQLAEFQAALQRGPRFSSVTEIREEGATADGWTKQGFFIDSTT
jgi:acylphosphatase